MYYFQTSYNGYSVYKTLAVDLSGPLLRVGHTHRSCTPSSVMQLDEESRPDRAGDMLNHGS